MASTTQTPPAHLRVLRKFGINETYQLAMYLLDQYRGTSLSCRYAIPARMASPESRPQLEQAVTAAVLDIIAKHPMLQVGTKNATAKTPSWVQLPRLNLSEHIQWLYLEANDDFAQRVQQVFAEQLDDKYPDFEEFLPHWKVTVIRQGPASTEMEVLLTWNHQHFDGAGARVLQEDLLASLNAMLNADSKDKRSTTAQASTLPTNTLTLPSSPPPNLPVPIEKLAKLSVGVGHFLRTVYQETRPPILTRDPSFAKWCPIRSGVPYKTQFRCFDVDAAALKTLIASCRENQTTITGLMHGLALVSFARHLRKDRATAFQCSTVMDHRRNLPADGTADGPWGGKDRAHSSQLVARIRGLLDPLSREKMGTEYFLSTELVREVWAVSAQSRKEIARQLELGLKNDIVGMFKFVGDWQQTMKEMAKRPRQFSWLVTNIGVLDGQGKRGGGDGGGVENSVGWSITRAQFGPSAETPAGAIEFSPASVAGGAMCVGANWHDCAVDVELGEAVVGDMERWLNQLAREK
ncbi:uncharacterized protein B0I36DRAFT_295901 [Microdochium trichocladiopsis]|uniref:Alcohol acetyltransferase n=1 Tax=Microdochium trichocladiopsis TaxID=1682393 RepID=A0A9P8XYF8_9PEZI|nr:uncharacterized protein B0I36DRAFT_295901 [Microdochium trichocladiopsis]KAH7025113.1 hypothetical protein B0I36DRAFT_295901 [Microdochium trichocladiopsis]